MTGDRGLMSYNNGLLIVAFLDSRYMRGRLTLDKVNAAINDMAAYAEANAQLIAAPKKKVYVQILLTSIYRYLILHLS